MKKGNIMKTLKVKTIKSEFQLNPNSSVSGTAKVKEFEDSINEFLSTIEADKIKDINYLNSSAKSGNDRNVPYSFLMAIISYYVD